MRLPFIARITSPATTPPRLLRVPSKPAALAGPFGSTVCMDTTSINLQKKQKKKKKKKLPYVTPKGFWQHREHNTN